MFCMKCKNDLADCTCPDLKERLAEISGVVVFGQDYAERILKQAKQNEGIKELKNIKPDGNH